MTEGIPVLLGCAAEVQSKVRYVFDTILSALALRPIYVDGRPSHGPWIRYGEPPSSESGDSLCVQIAHASWAWEFFSAREDADSVVKQLGVDVVFPGVHSGGDVTSRIDFDLAANAFYFLSSWSERTGSAPGQTRHLYASSVFNRLGVCQDVVDQYVDLLRDKLRSLGVFDRRSLRPAWPAGKDFAVVLSHDVDFIPGCLRDIVIQGAKTILRHLIKEGTIGDATQAATGLIRALAAGRDPYGCLPEIIREEKRLGVRSSFQVAVARRHPADVNYDVENPRIAEYLRVIQQEKFELCLHGSYRSTENAQWYLDEVTLLERMLGRPLGSRQHFLSFDYDALFAGQEKAGIRYDMSMGYPDRIGPRAGFSYPYFPYCLSEDRPYDVLQISLSLMDVTLRSYMGLNLDSAREAIAAEIEQLSSKGGGMSVVWHPIVFGDARDPGYADLYWQMVRDVVRKNGLATDGRTVNDWWRNTVIHGFRGRPG